MATYNAKARLASALFAGGSSNAGTSSATATADSSSGSVTVSIGGETVEIPTIGSVKDGDTVQIQIRNGKPVVVGVVGWGDAIQESVSATENHFWTDTSLGAVVSENERPDDISTLTGANTVLGSSGMAIRSGLVELAKFTSNLIELGKNSMNAVIKMCGGALTILADTSGTTSYAHMRRQVYGDTYAEVSVAGESGAEDVRAYAGFDLLCGNSQGDSGTYAKMYGRSATYSGSAVSVPAYIGAESGGYANKLYGWTAIVNGTSGTTETTISIANAQEVLIAAAYGTSPTTFLTCVVPAALIASGQCEYRLTGGNSSGTTGMAANVKLGTSKFSPQWFYRNGSDATSDALFYLFAH